VVLPALTPVAIPVVLPIVATPGVLLLHVPPAVISDNVVAVEVHNIVLPNMPVGFGFTVTVVVT